PGRSASTTRGACPTSRRPASTWPEYCDTGSRTCARARVSSRPAATDAARRGAVGALPNVLTLFRIGLVPVLVVALMMGTPPARIFAAGCFFVACVTDFFDGWLA